METITISTLDDFTLGILKHRAANEGKSPEEEEADLILESLGRGRDPETLIARARAVSAMTPKGVTQTESADLIREDRDR